MLISGKVAEPSLDSAKEPAREVCVREYVHVVCVCACVRVCQVRVDIFLHDAGLLGCLARGGRGGIRQAWRRGESDPGPPHVPECKITHPRHRTTLTKRRQQQHRPAPAQGEIEMLPRHRSLEGGKAKPRATTTTTATTRAANRRRRQRQRRRRRRQ